MIEVGDLVMVVRSTPCCNAADYNGHIYVVGKLIRGTAKCVSCGTIFDCVLAQESERICGAQIDRLRKIPPLRELTEQPIEVTA